MTSLKKKNAPSQRAESTASKTFRVLKLIHGVGALDAVVEILGKKKQNKQKKEITSSYSLFYQNENYLLALMKESHTRSRQFVSLN